MDEGKEEEITVESMTVEHAIALISYKGIADVAFARRACELLGVKNFDESLIMRWDVTPENTAKFYTENGFLPYAYGPGEGVDRTALSFYVADKLGAREDNNGRFPGSGFSGRGYQARANGQWVAKKVLPNS